MGQTNKNKSNKHNNSIWKYGAGKIVIYTEDKAIWERLRRSYSKIAVEMARYHREGERGAYARQYIAPLRRRKTFERILGVSMKDYGD